MLTAITIVVLGTIVLAASGIVLAMVGLVVGVLDEAGKLIRDVSRSQVAPQPRHR